MIVCAQAGNVSTGASDPIGAIVEAAHARGAWVHVDGAFGLWAAAVPELRSQVAGIETADSWATDAHKWLNVPYDSGLAIVADAAPHRAAMGLKASYLQRGADEERIGMDWVPDSSRRSRVLPLYALFRALGRDGIADIVRRNCALARRMAETLSRAPGVTILNDVVLNQVLVQFGDDETTRQVIAAVQADGTCWAGGAFWQGKQAMRISVSNWSTTEEDIDRQPTRCGDRSSGFLRGCLLRRRARPEFQHHVADGGDRPAGTREVVDAVRTHHRQLLAQHRHLLADVLRQLDDDRLGARRRHGLDAARSGAAADAIEQVLLGPELAQHHRAIDQRVVHRQHADGGGVFPIGLLELHELRRIGVPVVQLERNRHRAAMRWNGDEHPLLGVVAGQHVAEAAAAS